MPSQKILEQKQEVVKVLAEKMRNASAGVLVKYEGITVEDDTKLRAALRAAGVEYTVMKNSLIGRACDEVSFGEMKQYLTGMNAIAISEKDPIAPAKIMKEYAEKEYNPVTKGLDEGNPMVDLNYAVKESQEEAAKYGLLIIPGTEITRSGSKIGHFNALFTTDNNLIYDKDPVQAIRNAKAQGALIMHNHPGWKRKTVDMNEFHQKVYEANLINGIEIVNGGSFGPKLIQRCLANKLFVAAATDAHPITAHIYHQRGVFRTCTFVLAKDLTLKSVREALEKDRTLAYAYDNVMGAEELVSELFHNSVSMKVVYTSSKGEKTVVLTNTSSIPYYISRSGKGEGSPLYPFKSVSFKVAKDKDLTFKVMNLWTADDAHPNSKRLSVCYKAKDLK